MTLTAEDIRAIIDARTRMLTTDEVATVMCCRPRLVLEMVAAGEFPDPFRRGKPFLWQPAVIGAVLDGTWSPVAGPPQLKAVGE